MHCNIKDIENSYFDGHFASSQKPGNSGFKGFMTQYFLNMPYGDIGFQQMGRIGMAEHMRVDMFFKFQAFQGRSQNALNPTVTHMIFGILGIFSAIAARAGNIHFGLRWVL